MAKRSNNGAIKQRAYNKDYLMLGFIPSETLPIKPICFLCGEMLSNESMKPSKLMRHQHTKHAATISNDSSFFLRKKELYLSNQSANIVNLFTKKARRRQCRYFIIQCKPGHCEGQETSYYSRRINKAMLH